MIGVGVKKCLEVGHRHTVGMFVVNTQAATYIDVLYLNMLLVEQVLKIVDAVAQSLEVSHIKYL